MWQPASMLQVSMNLFMPNLINGWMKEKVVSLTFSCSRSMSCCIDSLTLQESVFSTSSGASGFSYSESIPVKPDTWRKQSQLIYGIAKSVPQLAWITIAEYETICHLQKGCDFINVAGKVISIHWVSGSHTLSVIGKSTIQLVVQSSPEVPPHVHLNSNPIVSWVFSSTTVDRPSNPRGPCTSGWKHCTSHTT